MRSESKGDGRGRRTLLTVGGVLFALAVVALASRGGTPVGEAGTRRPSQRLVDYAISLYLLLMVVGIGFYAYILLLRRDVMAEAVRRRRKKNPIVGFVVFLIAMGLLAAIVRQMSVSGGRGGDSAIARALRPRIPTGTSTDGGQRFEPQFALLPVLVVTGVAAAAIAAFALSARARRRALGSDDTGSLVEALVDVLEETLDDLRAERDPRRAVIAAYARLERTLAAFGLPRRPSEAPLEYLERVLGELSVTAPSVRRLTMLFQRAKFSQHEIGPQMKDEAIVALQTVQDELRAAQIEAEREREAALAMLRERANP